MLKTKLGVDMALDAKELEKAFKSITMSLKSLEKAGNLSSSQEKTVKDISDSMGDILKVKKRISSLDKKSENVSKNINKVNKSLSGDLKKQANLSEEISDQAKQRNNYVKDANKNFKKVDSALSKQFKKMKNLSSIEAKRADIEKKRQAMLSVDKGADTSVIDRKIRDLDKAQGALDSGSKIGASLSDGVDKALASPTSSLVDMAGGMVSKMTSLAAGIPFVGGGVAALGEAAKEAATQYAKLSFKGYDMLADLTGGATEALIQMGGSSNDIITDFGDFKSNINTSVQMLTADGMSLGDASAILEQMGNAGNDFVNNFMQGVVGRAEYQDALQKSIGSIGFSSALLGQDSGEFTSILVDYSKKLNKSLDTQLDAFESVAVAAKDNGVLSLDDYTQTILGLTSTSDRYNDHLDASNNMLYSLAKSAKLTADELKGLDDSVDKARDSVTKNFSVLAGNFSPDNWKELQESLTEGKDPMAKADIMSLIDSIKSGRGMNEQAIGKLTGMMSGPMAFKYALQASSSFLGKSLTDVNISSLGDLSKTFQKFKDVGAMDSGLASSLYTYLGSKYEGGDVTIGELMNKVSGRDVKLSDLKKTMKAPSKMVQTIKKANLTADEMMVLDLKEIYLSAGANISPVVTAMAGAVEKSVDFASGSGKKKKEKPKKIRGKVHLIGKKRDLRPGERPSDVKKTKTVKAKDLEKYIKEGWMVKSFSKDVPEEFAQKNMGNVLEYFAGDRDAGAKEEALSYFKGDLTSEKSYITAKKRIINIIYNRGN